MLANYSSPVFASWIAHAIGYCVCLVFVTCLPQGETFAPSFKKQPWIYLGGVPGALTVVLAAVTVNSSLGFSGSLSLMLVGQVLFGILTERFGIMDSQKRCLVSKDAIVVLLVLTGSWMLIFFRS